MGQNPLRRILILVPRNPTTPKRRCTTHNPSPSDRNLTTRTHLTHSNLIRAWVVTVSLIGLVGQIHRVQTRGRRRRKAEPATDRRWNYERPRRHRSIVHDGRFSGLSITGPDSFDCRCWRRATRGCHVGSGLQARVDRTPTTRLPTTQQPR